MTSHAHNFKDQALKNSFMNKISVRLVLYTVTDGHVKRKVNSSGNKLPFSCQSFANVLTHLSFQMLSFMLSVLYE